MDTHGVTDLALLARIELSEKEATDIAKDISAILAYVSDINEITADYVEKKEVGAHYNIMREDETTHEAGAHRDALLASSPQRKGDYIEVKKILGGESS